MAEKRHKKKVEKSLIAIGEKLDNINNNMKATIEDVNKILEVMLTKEDIRAFITLEERIKTIIGYLEKYLSQRGKSEITISNLDPNNIASDEDKDYL